MNDIVILAYGANKTQLDKLAADLHEYGYTFRIASRRQPAFGIGKCLIIKIPDSYNKNDVVGIVGKYAPEGFRIEVEEE